MTERTRRVTVLLPVYNGERHLGAAIESVLAQTFTDFELLVLDDGSTDGTVELVRRYPDPRIRLIARGHNLGLVATLNEGLQLARGAYLARHDADDVMRPERLARQVVHMDAHPEVCALGSAVRLLTDEDRVVGTWTYPTDAVVTRWALLFNSPLAHSATMLRTNVVRDLQGYSDRLPHVEDYELWSRLVGTGEIVSLAEPLQGYRLSEAGVSRRQETRQLEGRLSIACENAAQLLGHEVDRRVVKTILGSGTARSTEAIAGIAFVETLYATFCGRHQLTGRASLDLQDRYLQLMLDLLGRVPPPGRQMLVARIARTLPRHSKLVTGLGKLMLRVWR